MVDIATLAIAVDSTRLRQGTRDLDRMGDQATATGAQVARSAAQMTNGFNTTARAAQGMGGAGLRNTMMQLSQVAQQASATGRPLQALAIQLPDLTLAFGPLGIALGAAAGAFLPFIANALRAEDVTGDLIAELTQMPGGLSAMRASIAELSDLQDAYTQAIHASGGASTGLAARVVANSRTEFEARREVLEVEMQLLRIRGEEQRMQLQNLQDQQRMQIGNRMEQIELFRGQERDGYWSPIGAPNMGLGTELHGSAVDRMHVLAMQRLRAELSLTELALEEADAALEASFLGPGEAGDLPGTGGGRARAAQLADEVEQLTEAMEFLEAQQQTMQDGFLDAIVAGEDLTEVFQRLAATIARAALEAALFGDGPLAGPQMGGGLLGPLFSSIFGGFRAGGGPVSSGHAYMVGENGPELFAPHAPGTVVPDVGGNSGPGVTVNVINNSGEQVETRESRGPDGQRLIEVAVGRAIASGRFDRALGSRYGSKPQGTRR
ncbi:hypothetical protein [Roseicyclus persicicus]|uniref:Bacteriophage tail tape measure C-terminal domain-containing protein n=1 Tax=Roseicyclus persicicus TaxID=2650661 RepID=A0A7X6JVQ6_9RHOB|nr:hypothetical protein [Roseibacterium persicicum]NKX43602.1 hypothetical protein [Roseibacterium persicicum]